MDKNARLSATVSIFGILVSPLAIADPPKAENENGQAIYSQGLQLLKNGQVEAAANLLCQAAKASSESAMARAKYNTACGTALLQTKRWSEAGPFFQDAELADPTYAMLYSGWATYAERKDDYQSAIERYKKYLTLEKDPKRRAIIEPRLAAVKAKLADASPTNSSVVTVDDADCSKICVKLLQCKAGPWSTKDDCSEACDGAREDRTAAKVYRCAAKAKTCSAVIACAR